MKSLILLSLSTFFLLLNGCASSPDTHPPSKKFLKEIKSDINKKEDFIQPKNTTSENQAKAFLKANYFFSQRNYFHACKRYEYLASDDSFPLKDLAWIRSLKACEKDAFTMKKIWELEDKKFPAWLEEEYVETSLELAKKHKDNYFTAKFLYEYSKHKRLRKEKIKLLKEAQPFAKKSKNKKMIREIRDRIYKIAPRLNPHITETNKYSIARDFEGARQFEKARRLYRAIIRNPNASFEDKRKSWDRLRMSYKVQRQKPTFIHKTKKMMNFYKRLLTRYPKSSAFKKEWVRTSIKYSRALWTAHRRDEGRKILRNLLVYGINSTYYLGKIHWILGSMKVEEKKFEDAIVHYEIAYELELKDKKLNEKISWAIGWNLYLLKKYDKMIQHFEETYANTESFFYKLKLKYWTAVAYNKINNKSKSEKLLRELVREDSFGYYGIIAHMALDIPLEPIDLNERDKYLEDVTFEWLLALDEKVLSHRYLRSIQRKFKDADEVSELLPLYERAEWYEGGIFKFFSLKPEDRVEIAEDHLTSAFPLPYKELTLDASLRFNIPQGLIYSISRQESSFNPVIRSWADAFGVMQLTPERAKELAARHKIDYKNVNDLYDPKTNILLGTSLLGELKKKYKGNFISYVASYNANESVVQSWFRNRYDGDPIKFIEMIPYEETQGYVKLVFRNLITYKRLLGKERFYIKPEMLSNI